MKRFYIQDSEGYRYGGMVDGICCDELSEEIPSFLDKNNGNEPMLFKNRREANKEVAFLNAEVFKEPQLLEVKMIDAFKTPEGAINFMIEQAFPCYFTIRANGKIFRGQTMPMRGEIMDAMRAAKKEGRYICITKHNG